MSLHPDADAFVKAILDDPAELTTRLVFADWLEETGEPSNVAWAEFIRLNAEAERHPPDNEVRRDLEVRASEAAGKVTATLTLNAAQLVGRVEQLWRFVPKANITVRLVGFELRREVLEFVPESVAWENLVVPLDLRGQALRIAMVDPENYDIIQKLTFILNKDIEVTRADADEIRAAIEHCFGQYEAESVVEYLYEFVDKAKLSPEVADLPDARGVTASVVRLVNLMFQEAIGRGANGIRLVPSMDGVAVQYRVRGRWVQRDSAPARVWPGIATRICIMARIPVDVIIRRQSTFRGTIPLRIVNTPYDLFVTAGGNIDGILIEFDNPAAPERPG